MIAAHILSLTVNKCGKYATRIACIDMKKFNLLWIMPYSYFVFSRMRSLLFTIPCFSSQINCKHSWSKFHSTWGLVWHIIFFCIWFVHKSLWFYFFAVQSASVFGALKQQDTINYYSSVLGLCVGTCNSMNICEKISWCEQKTAHNLR